MCFQQCKHKNRFTLTVANGREFFLEHVANVLAERLRRRAVSVMDQIGADELAQRRRHVILDVLAQRKLLNGLATLQVPLLHVVVNVKLELVLAEVGLDRFERRLQANCRIQITLFGKNKTDKLKTEQVPFYFIPINIFITGRSLKAMPKLKPFLV